MLKRSRIKPRKKTIEQVESQRKSVTEMHSFFLKVWQSRPHICEISGNRLPNAPNSTFFHHILPKSKFPEAKLDSENIIILLPNIHEQVELDMYRYEEINRRREMLLLRYGYK